ncbi:MAG: efflux RND transporter periplasmic adaptor subunit [Opitutales bacterium]
MWRFPVVAAATSVALLLVGCGEEAGEAPAAPPPTVEVLTVEPEETTLRRELPGRVHPFVVAEVRPQVTGIVEERRFTEGGLVEAGDVLYELDDATYRAERDRAAANLQRAEASLELARTSADRTRGLAETDAVSQQELDNALAGLRQAEADVAVARAALQSAEVLLGYTDITSPVSGRIGRSGVTEGALVTANQATPLATVQQLDPIYVDLTRSSSEMLRLRRALAEGDLEPGDGLPVELLLEDGTVYEHAGEVAFSEAQVDPTTGSFLLRVVAPNPDHVLLPGMYVRAAVGLGVREDAILVPQQAVTRGPGGNSVVMVVRDNSTVESRAVMLGQTVDNRWLVEHGLLPGDRVVVEGLQRLRPEMRVNVGGGEAATAPEAAE